MLKRSPRSQIATYAIVIACIIAAYIAFDALANMRAMTKNHGKRVGYYSVDTPIPQGEKIDTSFLTRHEMFSGDAPNNAIHDPKKLDAYAVVDLAKGTILTTEMLSTRAIDSIDSSARVMFIPTEDQLSPDISPLTDLLAVDPEGFGADVIAENARILFGLTPHDDESTSHRGYFVQVTEDEAQEIAVALSQGDVRFALRQSDG